MPSKELRWEIRGRDIIREKVQVKSSSNEQMLVVRTDGYVSFVILDSATAKYNIRTNNIAKLRKTGDHLLIQKTTKTTTLVPGVEVHD